MEEDFVPLVEPDVEAEGFIRVDIVVEGNLRGGGKREMVIFLVTICQLSRILTFMSLNLSFVMPSTSWTWCAITLSDASGWRGDPRSGDSLTSSDSTDGVSRESRQL